MQAIGFVLRDLAHEWAGWIAALAGFATAAAVAFLAPRLAHVRIMPARLAVLPRRTPPHIPAAVALADTQIDWEGLATHIESRADRLHAIDALHKSGRQIIAAAEFALDDLIADCVAVLLPPLELEPVPHVHPAVAEPPAEDELPANSLAA